MPACISGLRGGGCSENHRVCWAVPAGPSGLGGSETRTPLPQEPSGCLCPPSVQLVGTLGTRHAQLTTPAPDFCQQHSQGRSKAPSHPLGGPGIRPPIPAKQPLRGQGGQIHTCAHPHMRTPTRVHTTGHSPHCAPAPAAHATALPPSPPPHESPEQMPPYPSASAGRASPANSSRGAWCWGSPSDRRSGRPRGPRAASRAGCVRTGGELHSNSPSEPLFPRQGGKGGGREAGKSPFPSASKSPTSQGGSFQSLPSSRSHGTARSERSDHKPLPAPQTEM